MAKDTSPLCVRFSPEERQLIELLALYRDETKSEFVRKVVVAASNRIVETKGIDKIVQAVDDRNAEQSRRRAEAAQHASRSGNRP